MGTAYSYELARSDFEYLESLVELEDQVDLDAERLALMRDPTPRRAARMYAAGCQLWMQRHSNPFSNDARVLAIKKRLSWKDASHG